MAQSRNILVSVVFRIVICTAVLIVAGGVMAVLVFTAPRPAPSTDTSTAVQVRAFAAQPVPVRRSFEGFGTCRALHAADVPARVSAVVVERPERIRAGSSVSAGEVLVQLDDRDFVNQQQALTQTINDLDSQLSRLEVERASWTRRAELAEEEVRLSQAEFDRIRAALERDAAREREVDQQRRSLVVAQLALTATKEELDKIGPRRSSLLAQRAREEQNLAQARLNVERCRIVSPLDGVLAAVDVEIGENVSVGQRVARVVDVREVEVGLLLPASARPFIAPGDQVELSVSGSTTERTPLTGQSNEANGTSRNGSASFQKWTATVKRVSPVDDEQSRTMRIYAEVTQNADDPGVLSPGRFVRGVVRSSIEESRWVVPRRAISSDRLMTIEQGKVRSRSADIDFNVQGAFPALGLPDQHWAVLRDALSPGTLVVVDGSRALTEGSDAKAILSDPAGETMIGGGAGEPDAAASPGIDHRRAESSGSP